MSTGQGAERKSSLLRRSGPPHTSPPHPDPPSLLRERDTEPSAVAVSTPPPADTDALAVRIDSQLDAEIWHGSQFVDRVNGTIRIVGQSMADEIQRSLFAQESYDEFEARMLGFAPLEPETGSAAMRAMDLALDTEVRRAWNAGIEAAMAGDEDTLTVWRAQMDDRTTEMCWQRHGLELNTIGARPPAHFRCFAGDTVVAGSVLFAQRMFYAGPIVHLRTRAGSSLRLTPNHPILTPFGFVRADALQQGQQVLRNSTWNSRTIVGEQVDNGPARIAEIFDALSLAHNLLSAPTSLDDFYGDAFYGKGDVDIVGANSILLHRLKTSFADKVVDVRLQAVNESAVFHASLGTPQARLSLDGGRIIPNTNSLRAATQLHACLKESKRQGGLADSQFLGETLSGRAGQIAVYPDLPQMRHAAELGGIKGGTEPSLSGVREPDAKGMSANSKLAPQLLKGFTGQVALSDFLDRQRNAKRYGMPDQLDTTAADLAAQCGFGHPEFAAKFAQANPGLLALDEISDIQVGEFVGHVYDLETVNGLILADGIVASNCRCDIEIIPSPDSADPDMAEMGRERLDEMDAERESGQGVMESARVKPSRLFRFREVAA